MRSVNKLRNLFLAGVVALGAGAFTAAAAAPRGGAAPSITEQTLYSFCSLNNCADGGLPLAGLIMDGAGNLYGTTATGGTGSISRGGGTVFQLTPSGTGWSEKVLYSFCPQGSCPDGLEPAAGLIMDGAGNLYGTTFVGGNPGAASAGVVFQLTQTSTGWSEKVLYRFCSQSIFCLDGATR